MNCSQHQLSMNICMFREFVEADLKMNDEMKDGMTRVPTECRALLGQRQEAWSRKRDRWCNLQADEETGGSGSMRPMIYSSCRAVATRERLKIVQGMSNAEIFASMSLNMPLDTDPQQQEAAAPQSAVVRSPSR